jgi:TRAP-type C4-dicarboxylate transport system permease large subunit
LSTTTAARTIWFPSAYWPPAVRYASTGNGYARYGIIMIVNVEFGFLTFPFGLNLFVAMGITGQPLTRIGRAVFPFLVLLLLGLLIITYVPAISTGLPNLLMN